jgi:hypothetical protein
VSINRMHLVPLALAGLTGLTIFAGVVIFALTPNASTGADTLNTGLVSTPLSAQASYSGPHTPERLVGTWSSSRVSMINYRDRTTGSFSPPSGSIFTYTIAANGTYEYSGYMQSSLYHCTITVFRWQRGTIAANGADLTLTPREGKLYYKDSCRAGSEKEKAVVDEPQRYRFSIETENAHTVLVMKKASGDDWGKFYRKK